MNEETNKKIIGIIEDVMGVDVTKIEKDKQINTISEWDSFNNLMLISRLQEEFGIEFTAEEIEDTQTIGNLLSLLDKKIKEK